MQYIGKISVIVPVYNAGRYLKECIESIIKQTYKNVELILVDDGSEDDSADIIDEYKRKYPRICTIKKKNGGPNSARKAGLDIAEGEYIMFVDADDYIQEDMCECLIQAIIEHNVDMVWSGIIKIYDDGRNEKIRQSILGRISGRELSRCILDIDNFYTYNISTSLYGILFRKKIILNIFKLFDNRITFSEDCACVFLSCMDAKAVYVIDKYLYCFRLNEYSLTHNHKKDNYITQKYLYRYMQKELKHRDADNDIYREIEQLIIRDLLIAGYSRAFGHCSFLYPYDNVTRGKKIAIYGAGAFGIELYQFITQSQLYEVAVWVDKEWDRREFTDKPVQSPLALMQEEYDFVVIAITNNAASLSVKKELINMGVDSEKIKRISEEMISYEYLPANFVNEDTADEGDSYLSPTVS